MTHTFRDRIRIRISIGHRYKVQHTDKYKQKSACLWEGNFLQIGF